jgi:hypothetical protein
MDSQHASTMNHGTIANATLQKKAPASLGHKQDFEQFVEISYARIGLSIADITVV